VTNLCEIPIVSATALDETLTSSGPGKAAIQKYRHEMRKKLDPGLKISIGRGGTVWLTGVPTLSCVATATRWNMQDALKLVSTYKKAGFVDLTHSKDYRCAMQLVGKEVSARVRGVDSKSSKVLVMEIIPACWNDLAAKNEIVRRVTMSMRDIFLKIDKEIEEVRRFPGRFVRFEDDMALITVDTGEREELRTVDGKYLKSVGISWNGAPFVLQEYRWSPDTTMSVYFPAIDLDYDAKADAELLDRLKSRQRPMPEPPAGLLQPDFVSEKITDGEKRLSYPEPAEASDAALPQPSRVKAG